MKETKYKIEEIREKFIKELDAAIDKNQKAKQLADELFTLSLTMYSKNYSFKSIVFNSFAQSVLDENISLHPEQLNIMNELELNEGVILSAPTSFGKTFVVFEYIARNKPKNVVLVVPTLALVDEYNKKIINKYQSVFHKYNVYMSLNEEYDYNFEQFNIFILTHDRVVDNTNYSIFKSIDFLVIDEVYKLQRNAYDDRVLVLNLAYYFLVQNAKKHLLLAPFIGGIENIEKLKRTPKFFKTNFSPVVNQIKTYDIISDQNVERYININKIISSKEILDNDKVMIYFPTVSMIYSYIKKYLPISNQYTDDTEVIDFINWIKNEIHEEWYIVKAIENGFLVHNGQLPIGIRLFLLDLYENHDHFNKLLCTSTLLEGVNTSAKHVIISKPSRVEKDHFDAFDFYNLVGRSGRLLKHFLGIAHYIKGPNDPDFKKEEALKEIKFEITDDSQDINIHLDNIENDNLYQSFLKELNISHEEYKINIGSKFRFKTVYNLYLKYKQDRSILIEELHLLRENKEKGRLNLVRILYKIFEGNNNKLITFIINQILNKNRLKTKAIIEKTRKSFDKVSIDHIITSTLKLKSSYVEYDFYSKLTILLYFMERNNIDKSFTEIIDVKIKQSIDYIYFNESRAKRMLKDLGIYERDINTVISIIGDEFNDTFELKRLLLKNKKMLKQLSIISKYVISSLN